MRVGVVLRSVLKSDRNLLSPPRFRAFEKAKPGFWQKPLFKRPAPERRENVEVLLKPEIVPIKPAESGGTGRLVVVFLVSMFFGSSLTHNVLSPDMSVPQYDPKNFQKSDRWSM
eukprot:Rmarinus@m.21161